MCDIINTKKIIGSPDDAKTNAAKNFSFRCHTRTERSTWGKWNPFAPRVNNLDLAVKIISSCSKRKMNCLQIIHLTQKNNFLPQEYYIWFQTIFVLHQEDFHKRIFLLPIMDHFSACSITRDLTKRTIQRMGVSLKKDSDHNNMLIS